ncbi:MAG: SgcJ/EcaC family oxidoreductase [Pirellulaceae bacterium]
MNTTKSDTACTDENAIRKLMRDWSDALESKDVDAMMAHYCENAVLYDAVPPYKAVGVETIKNAWNCCLPYFPAEFRSEHADVTVHVAGDVAVVYGMHHFVPTPADHPCGQTWMRVTLGFQRMDGEWKVVHEHCSIPFNPMNNQAWYIRDPNVVDMPDYGSGGCQSG